MKHARRVLGEKLQNAVGANPLGIIKRLALVIRSYVKTTAEQLDRIAAEEELRESVSRSQTVFSANQSQSTFRPVSTQTEADYRILGLEPGADLIAVECAWRKLASRADPKRFPPGSPEEKRAAEILKKLNEAYYRLREILNPTEGRFGRLEL